MWPVAWWLSSKTSLGLPSGKILQGLTTSCLPCCFFFPPGKTNKRDLLPQHCTVYIQVGVRSHISSLQTPGTSCVSPQFCFILTTDNQSTQVETCSWLPKPGTPDLCPSILLPTSPRQQSIFYLSSFSTLLPQTRSPNPVHSVLCFLICRSAS